MLVFVYSTRYFCPILMKLEFSRHIFGKKRKEEGKKEQISNLMKIRPVGAELFHADRRTGGRT